MSRLFDLRGGPPGQDHFANPVGQVEQLADGRAPLEAAPAAVDAAGALEELMRLRQRGAET